MYKLTKKYTPLNYSVNKLEYLFKKHFLWLLLAIQISGWRQYTVWNSSKPEQHRESTAGCHICSAPAIQKVFNLQFTLPVTQADSLNVFLNPLFFQYNSQLENLFSVAKCLFCSMLICSVPCEQLTRCQLITQMRRNRYSDDCTT